MKLIYSIVGAKFRPIHSLCTALNLPRNIDCNKNIIIYRFEKKSANKSTVLVVDITKKKKKKNKRNLRRDHSKVITISTYC